MLKFYVSDTSLLQSGETFDGVFLVEGDRVLAEVGEEFGGEAVGKFGELGEFVFLIIV